MTAAPQPPLPASRTEPDGGVALPWQAEPAPRR